MRVLHVIPSVAPVRGGPSQAVLQLVGALNQRGIHAEIAATNDNGPELLDIPLGRCIEFSGAPVWFFQRFSPKMKTVREFAFSAALTKWLWRNIPKYDLVHVHACFSYACTIAMFIARRKQLQYVVSPHGLLCNWSMQQSVLRKTIYLAAVERSNLNASAGIEYATDQELAEAEPLQFKSSSFVVPFGIDLPELLSEARQELRARLKVPQDEPVILFLSRLHPKKGLEYLFAGLEIIAARRFSLVVAGSGSVEYEAELRCRIDSSPLKGRVHFVGFARDQFKQILLQGADLFALTSHSESFAIAAMEAMAAGTPALVTPGVPLASIIEKFNTGWVSPLEPAAIASAIRSVLDSALNIDVIRARRERCLSLAANFSWEHIAARMEDVYDSVMNRRQPPSFELNQESLILTGR
jgi:glycosyltransferase involved in cell wall biosynthesis